ncbi:MAG: hypothetical protein BAA02_02740 [Paenibacillaceae bacterium ZCTH02-B3]|nr:MAG: hypothetical protein BAA02_02740 [Paenibacillaceae bacterium ZCTH02-B3]
MRALAALATALILAGCAWIDPATNVVEEISPTILMYLHLNEDSELESTIVVPAVKNEQKQVLTARGKTLKETRQKLNFGYSREFKSGQLRMLFLSEELARKGIIRCLNTLLLDQEISDRMYLAVVRGDFTGLLRKQIQEQKNYDRILYKRFRHYKHQVTSQNLHFFLREYYSPYADPRLPLFEVRDGQLVYSGTALFLDDRMVGAIPGEADAFFQMIDNGKGYFPNITSPEHDVVLGKVTTARKIKYDAKNERIVITVHLEGQVDEYTGDLNLGDPQEAERFMRGLKEDLEARILEVVRSLQELSVDPLRAGLSTVTLFRERFPGGEWRKRWPELTVTVRVDLGLSNLGMSKPEE